jgi:hypothetical protein
LTILHYLANLPNLTISIKLVDRRIKQYSQANHLRASAYMPIPGLDAAGVIPELN